MLIVTDILIKMSMISYKIFHSVLTLVYRFHPHGPCKLGLLPEETWEEASYEDDSTLKAVQYSMPQFSHQIIPVVIVPVFVFKKIIWI